MGFVANHNLESDIAHSDEMRDVLESKAQEVADEARRIARAEAYQTGAYHDSIRAVVGERDDGEVVGRVLASDYKAVWIEVGTAQGFTARSPLRRALEVLGD